MGLGKIEKKGGKGGGAVVTQGKHDHKTGKSLGMATIKFSFAPSNPSGGREGELTKSQGEGPKERKRMEGD